MCPGHQGLEYGMETIGTSASGPQPTAAHLSSPTLTHRDQGSAPFPASLTPPFPPQCLLPPPPPPVEYPPLSRVSSAPGLPVNSAATSLASASVRPTTQECSVSPCRSKE